MELTKYRRKEDTVMKWYEIDAAGLTLGRLATRVADILRGKNKADYTPSVDCGDYVVIINAEKIHLSGNKWSDKKYYRHSGYQSGIKETSAENLIAKHPDQLIKKAVKGMLPKTKLASQIYTKLKVYAGTEHPHTAQQPERIEL